eukprot:s1541_g1.t1
MAGSWLLAPLLLAQALASPDVTCLSSIKVIDNFLSDAEAQAVITDLEAQKPQRSGSERASQEAPVLAQRLKSELRSKEQEAQLSNAVEVLEPVGEISKLIHEVSGHATLEKRLRETMTGKDAAQLEASKSSVGIITVPPSTTTTKPETTTEAPKGYYRKKLSPWWWKRGYSGYGQQTALVQDGSSDAVHFMQMDKNGSQKEL